jgi:hypothetical protein
LFSGSLAISPAYAHVVEFGEPVEIGGLRISPGDLLRGDLHGIHSIPAGYAGCLIRIARALIDKEQELFRLRESEGFSVEKVCAALEDQAGVTVFPLRPGRALSWPEGSLQRSTYRKEGNVNPTYPEDRGPRTSRTPHGLPVANHIVFDR